MGSPIREYELNEQCSFGIKVAELSVGFDLEGGSALKTCLPPTHWKFAYYHQYADNNKKFAPTLALKIQNRQLRRDSEWNSLVCRTKIWELWKDIDDHYVFYNPLQPDLREVNIEPNFKQGVVLGNFKQNQAGVRPLPQGLEIVLFSNLFATFGDLILHASGFIYEDKGYIFTGHSGAGKSTLIRQFLNRPEFTVMGEDQVVLRFINNNFWVYGTPWHVDPRVCSPKGAPLEGIFFLKKEYKNHINSIRKIEGIEELLQTAFVPYYRHDMIPMLLERLEMLSNSAQFITLSYQLGTDVWKLIKSIE